MTFKTEFQRLQLGQKQYHHCECELECRPNNATEYGLCCTELIPGKRWSAAICRSDVRAVWRMREDTPSDVVWLDWCSRTAIVTTYDVCLTSPVAARRPSAVGDNVPFSQPSALTGRRPLASPALQPIAPPQRINHIASNYRGRSKIRISRRLHDGECECSNLALDRGRPASRATIDKCLARRRFIKPFDRR